MALPQSGQVADIPLDADAGAAVFAEAAGSTTGKSVSKSRYVFKALATPSAQEVTISPLLHMGEGQRMPCN
jgi:hypothetical protein